jgi:hypothetical protein
MFFEGFCHLHGELCRKMLINKGSPIVFVEKITFRQNSTGLTFLCSKYLL